MFRLTVPELPSGNPCWRLAFWATRLAARDGDSLEARISPPAARNELRISVQRLRFGLNDWFDRCSVGLTDFEYVVDLRGFEPLTF